MYTAHSYIYINIHIYMPTFYYTVYLYIIYRSRTNYYVYIMYTDRKLINLLSLLFNYPTFTHTENMRRFTPLKLMNSSTLRMTRIRNHRFTHTCIYFHQYTHTCYFIFVFLCYMTMYIYNIIGCSLNKFYKLYLYIYIYI